MTAQRRQRRQLAPRIQLHRQAVVTRNLKVCMLSMERLSTVDDLGPRRGARSGSITAVRGSVSPSIASSSDSFSVPASPASSSHGSPVVPVGQIPEISIARSERSDQSSVTSSPSPSDLSLANSSPRSSRTSISGV